MSEYTFEVIHPLSALRYYDKVMPQLQKSIDASGGERDPGQCYDNVLRGEWMLVVGKLHGEYAGFGMLEQRIGVHTRQLNIPFGFSPGTWKGVRAFFNFVETYAMENGFGRMVISSCRKGYDKFANRLGYKQDIVEYTKEI